MWTHLGAPKLCSHMRAAKQALQYPCAPSTCWITSPIAENVQTTNSSRPSTFMMCKLPRQLNRVLTTAASFTLMGCLGAASILTACSKVVTLATKYCFSELNCLCSCPSLLGTYVVSCLHVWPFHPFDYCVHRLIVKTYEHANIHTCNMHTNMHAYMHNCIMCTCACTSTPHMHVYICTCNVCFYNLKPCRCEFCR